MVYNFLCKDEKNTQKYLLTFALNIGVERSPPFFRTVYPNRNHVTTHPDQYCSLQKQSKTTSADPDGGAFPDRPGKSQVIWVSIGNKQLEPSPWKKVGPPWKMLDTLCNLEK